MISKSVLQAADVKRIAAAAEAEALKNGWAVTIAVVDDGGHLLSLQRLDGAAPISAQIAAAKARSAAMPALAICASSPDLTPLTPTAPTHCPSTVTGTPPSSMPSSPGTLRNETRPWLIISS